MYGILSGKCLELPASGSSFKKRKVVNQAGLIWFSVA